MIGETNTAYTFMLGGGFSVVAYFIGGIDNLIVSLAIMMCVDFISGVLVAGKKGYEQSLRQKQTGIKEEKRVGISSKKAFTGLLRKMAMLLAVVVAVQLDILMVNEGDFMRNAMILCFIGTEGISFTENLGKMGISLPANFVKMFSQLTQDDDNKPTKE